MNEVIEYIIKFLLPSNEKLADRIGYTADTSQFANYDIVIIPSSFFNDNIYGSPESEPQLPLATLKDVPILFGSSEMKEDNGTTIVYADIIASTYFLISRYEEYIHPTDNRDAHGRYIGTKSIPYRANFIHRPIVDEYSDLLLKWLKEKGHQIIPSTPDYQKIYLTHDIDCISYYRSIRGLLGGLKRNFSSIKKCKRVFQSILKLENDPAYTFPYILKQDKKVSNATSLFFIKSAVTKHPLDRPSYQLKGNDFQKIYSLLKKANCQFGLHTSYYAGEYPSIISEEKQKLEDAIKTSIQYNRWHFLRTLSANDFTQLIDANLSDDFTMGYADIVGFRLGTSRPVQWINPATRNVTQLTLHPLVVMDCTLSNTNYMNLNKDNALSKTLELLHQIKKHHGEVVLLWHNTIFSEIEDIEHYHTELYNSIIEELSK